VAISPEQPNDSLSSKEKNELTFPVLSDQGLHVAKSFKITFSMPQAVVDLCLDEFNLDLRKINGVDHFDLPIPATYVVGKNGAVEYAFVDADYTTRAEPVEILHILEELSGEH
jgi:peroxiredoxin